MIEPVPGRSWEVTSTGIHLVPPEGTAHGFIVYQERLRPLRRAIEVVVSLGWPHDLDLAGVSPPERVITAEGEYAALVSVRGRVAGVACRQTVGLVFGDDFYSLLLGVARTPEIGAAGRSASSSAAP